jgi:hypothetical protein
MSQQLVRSLIEQRVRDWAEENDLPMEWESDVFTPPATAYGKFNLLPAETRSDDLAGKFRTWQGVAQITLAVPAGNGPAAAGELVKSLDETFPVYLNLVSDPSIDLIALTVIVMTPVNAPQGFADKGHWLVPAYFRYRCDYVAP